MNFGKGTQIGFIAQEVEAVLPQWVTTNVNRYKSVAYANVAPVLVQAVNTLKKDNDHKEERLSKVETENAELKARLAVLERAVAMTKVNSK